ncbi:MAG: membrane protein insertase YidC [Rhodospirillales bacterium]|nr:membrane protein insertase YidC [Alphaproteobacteria bacterium]USO03911.1 MAG: membrane protein insertase YidC [Rhodospirillales bacterium]
MQNKDEMHPNDIRNLILFMVLSVALWAAYDHFILAPQAEAIRAQREAVAAAVKESQVSGVPFVEEEKPRDEVISQTARVPFENEDVSGSVNLTGGRIDDLSLKNYFKTIEKKKRVSLLSPSGAAFARYMEFGWVTSDKSVKMPDKNTVWKAGGSKTLSPQTPVTLTWSNGQGVSFEKTISLDEEYGFTLSQRVVNKGSKTLTFFPYALISQKGFPEEYAGRWVVHEGPLAYVGNEMTERSYGDLVENPREKFEAVKGWIGITEKDWLVALAPDQKEFSTFRFAHTPGALPKDAGRYQSDIMGQARTIGPGESARFENRFFAGAKKIQTLNAYEEKWNLPHFDLAIDFGIYYFLTRPFFFILNFFYGLVGNFGVAIIMFTVVLRLAVFPLANTSYKSFAKMRKVSPKVYNLRHEYKDDKKKLQEELVKLYQKEEVNPMAGCLPIIVQIPIFFALFKVLSNTIEMRHAPFFGWIKDLSAPDPTTVFNLFGLIPWDPPQALMIGAWPVMMLITSIAQRKMSPPPQDKMQARIIAAMPWLMCFILAKFASGLVIYWTFSNLLAVIQQYVITRSMGVEVHLFSRDKDIEQMEEAVEEGPSIHPGLEMVEEEVEEALFGEEEDSKDSGPEKPVSKPKPRKKKKK